MLDLKEIFVRVQIKFLMPLLITQPPYFGLRDGDGTFSNNGILDPFYTPGPSDLVNW